MYQKNKYNGGTATLRDAMIRDFAQFQKRLGGVGYFVENSIDPEKNILTASPAPGEHVTTSKQIVFTLSFADGKVAVAFTFDVDNQHEVSLALVRGGAHTAKTEFEFPHFNEETENALIQLAEQYAKETCRPKLFS